MARVCACTLMCRCLEDLARHSIGVATLESGAIALIRRADLACLLFETVLEECIQTNGNGKTS
jgi:hypothetical protein